MRVMEVKPHDLTDKNSPCNLAYIMSMYLVLLQTVRCLPVLVSRHKNKEDVKERARQSTVTIPIHVFKVHLRKLTFNYEKSSNFNHVGLTLRCH